VVAGLEKEESVDPALGELMEGGPADEEVSVMIRLREGAEPPADIRVVSRFGEIATVRLRRDQVLPTWESDRVVSVKAGRKVYPAPSVGEAVEGLDGEVDGEVDGEASGGEAAPMSLSPLPEDGTGVVVGICDWGLDVGHPNFRNADGTTRVQSLWDQRGRGDPRAPAPFGYGRVLSRSEIDAGLARAQT
jgi:hypothetical protein